MNLDIVVPVFNGEKYIDTFIESYLYSKKDIEHNINLRIVDNGSKDGTSHKIKKFCKKNKDINYYFFDKKIGSYAARNYGVQNTTGEIILFTDIDCEFSPSFFKNFFRIDFSADSFYGGKVEIRVYDNNNPWEILDSGSHMKNQNLLFATANMFLKRSLFDSVGSFDETISGGDHAWSKRALLKGFKPSYIDDVIVFHPPRQNYKEFEKKYLRIACGDAIIRQKIGYVSYITGLIRFIIKIPLLPYSNKKFTYVDFKSYVLFRLDFIKIRINQLIIYLKTPTTGFKSDVHR